MATCELEKIFIMENVAPQFVAKSGIVESHFILFFVIFTLF